MDKKEIEILTEKAKELKERADKVEADLALMVTVRDGDK